MIEAFISNDAIHSFVVQAENTRTSSVYEKQIEGNNDRYIKLSMSFDFFEFLYKYYTSMNLTNDNIEYMVLELDDLIDEFEEYANNTNTDKYSRKASEFYTLLTNLQMNLGFYLSDRKYAV